MSHDPHPKLGVCATKCPLRYSSPLLHIAFAIQRLLFPMSSPITSPRPFPNLFLTPLSVSKGCLPVPRLMCFTNLNTGWRSVVFFELFCSLSHLYLSPSSRTFRRIAIAPPHKAMISNTFVMLPLRNTSYFIHALVTQCACTIS